MSATDLALGAWESRPARAEVLADLARRWRELGMNETAAMVARRGLAIPPADDLLFVETGAADEFRLTLAICGYYSRDPETRRAAAGAAEALALDRSAPRGAVDQARNVLFWHAPRLATLAPSWEARRLEFEAPPGWRAMNPSVVRHDGRTLAIVRCVNYWIEPDGGYTFPDGEPAIRTRNFLCELGPLHVARDPVEVAPDLGPVLYGGVLGLEDLRLFVWRDELRFICAARQMNPEGRVEQVVGRLDRDGTVYDLTPVRQPWVAWCEKNWQPIQGAETLFDSAHFIYRTDPTMIVDPASSDGPGPQQAPWAADNWSGSTPLIPFDGGWLGMVHEPLASPINGRRLNQQRWVWYDETLSPARRSRRWIFKLNEEIEYVVGLCRAPTSDDLIVSYGSHDRQAWVGTVDANDVRQMLGMEAMMERDIITGTPSVPYGRPTAEPESEPRTTQNDDYWDRLGLDPNERPEIRATARIQLHRRLRPVGEVFPSWTARRLKIAPPEGYAAMAPSLVAHMGRWVASVRCINYGATDAGGYARIADGTPMGGEVVPESRTLLIEVDPDTRAARSLGEIARPVLFPPQTGARSLGFEDMRLFEHDGSLWGIAAFGERSEDNLVEQWLVRVGCDLRMRDASPITPHRMARRSEKNWMPFVDRGAPRFIYACGPATVVLDKHGRTVSSHEPPFAVEHLRGGSQAVPFDGGWLAAVHWLQVMDDADPWVKFQYRNRFVWLDEDYWLKKLSPGFVLPTDPSVAEFPRNFQLIDGLAWHPDGARLAVGYELYEREPWVGLIDADDVRRALRGA